MAGIGRRKARPGKIIVDWRDGGGVRHYKEFPDTKAGEHDALELLVRVRRQAQTGKVVPDERLTLGEYYEAWMQATRYGLAANTLKSRASIFETHVLPNFRRVPIVRMNRAAVRAFLAALLEKKYAPATVHQVLLVLGSLFSYAVDNGDLEANPVAGLGRRMHLGSVSEVPLAMSRDQLGQFLAGAREGTEYFALALLVFSGVRVSEARGLQLGDVGYSDNRLRVERQVHDSGEVARLKSQFSIRSVEVPESLVNLSRDRASEPRNGPWLLSPTWPEDVSSSLSGARYKAICTAMRGALAVATLPDHFTPHSLRHTFARLHLEAGKDLLWVSRQLGHSSIAITADTYGRWAKLRGDGAADALAASVEGQPLRAKVVHRSDEQAAPLCGPNLSIAINP